MAAATEVDVALDAIAEFITSQRAVMNKAKSNSQLASDLDHSGIWRHRRSRGRRQGAVCQVCLRVSGAQDHRRWRGGDYALSPVTTFAPTADGLLVPRRPSIIRPTLDWLDRQRRALKMDGQWFPRQAVQFEGRGVPLTAAGGITVEASDTIEMGDGATEVVTLPGTPAENDIYIVALARDTEQSVGAAAASAGWTKLYDGGGGAAPVTAVFLKRMTSTPDTTITLEGDSSFNRPTAVAMLQVKGVDTTTALDAALTSATGGPGLPDPPSHTTATADALRIVTGHLDDDDDSSWTLSGWTVITQGVGGGTTNGGTVGIGYKLAPSTGAENPGAFSGSRSDAWTATHFSLRPAA